MLRKVNQNDEVPGKVDQSIISNISTTPITSTEARTSNKEHLLNNIVKPLFERIMSVGFCPEIAEATTLLYPYFGFNQTTAQAFMMAGTSVLLGILLPIQQNALRMLTDIVFKNPYAFDLYGSHLLIFVATKCLIPIIHSKNAVSCKGLREKLSFMLREEIGSNWLQSKAFIGFSETDSNIIDPSDNLVKKTDTLCQNLVNLINERISILSHCIGALYSLYLISVFFEISLMGLSINIPYLILISISYGYIYNIFATSTNAAVKQNIREKAIATDKLSKQVANSLSEIESMALIGGENFESSMLKTKLHDIYSIDQASLKPQSHLSFLNKILWEYSEVLGLITQPLTGNLNPADALNSGKNFRHIADQAGFWNGRLDLVKTMEQCAAAIKTTLQAIDQYRALVKNCRITYNETNPMVKNEVIIDLKIPTKDGFGLIEINKKLEAGKTYRIKGPNGAGKTTLLELLKGGINPTLGSGTVIKPSNHLFLPNTAYILKGNSYSLMQTILYPSIEEATEDQIVLTKQLLEKLELKEVINELTSVGVIDWAQGQSSEQKQNRRKQDQKSEQKQNRGLSSGQKQKIAIIRCLVKKPDAIFLDEPFAQMDPTSRKTAINLLHEYLPTAVILYIEHKHNDTSLNNDELHIVEEAF